MKLFVLGIVSLVVGGALGVALAYVDVGEVESSFAPAGDALAGGDGAGPERQAPATPRVEVDEPTYDFGTMQKGTTASHRFVFRNTGDAPLRLEVGRTSCKCTLGEVADRPLAPGESTPVVLEWTAKSGIGPFRQTASVTTNDPKSPKVELAVEGLVTEVTSLQPKEFLLGRLSADEAGEASVYVVSYDADAPPLEVTAALGDGLAGDDRFEFEVEPVPADELPVERAESGVKITVRAGPGLPLGHVMGWVSVETNRTDSDASDEGTTIQVPLLAIVEGDISVHGAGWSKELGVLNLGKVKSAQGKSAKLRVSYKGDHAATSRATVASVDPAWLEVELGEPREVRPGVVHQPMEVRVPPGKPSMVRRGPGQENGGQGDGDAQIRLAIEHPATPELDVKVRFVIAE